MASTRSEIIATVRSIAADSQKLLKIAKQKAGTDQNLTAAEIRQIKKLVQQSEASLSDAKVLAKERRGKEIEELEKAVKRYDSSLSVPNMDPDDIAWLKKKKRRATAQLADKRAREALDFAGLLSKRELDEIELTLKDAKEAVAKRKKAAGFIKTLLQVADLSLGVVKKAAAVV